MFDVLLLFSDLVYGSTCTSSDQCQTGLTCSNFVCECPEGTSFDGGSNMCMICKYDGHIDCSMFQILYDYLLMHCNFTPANQALGVYRNHPHLSISPFVRASIWNLWAFICMKTVAKLILEVRVVISLYQLLNTAVPANNTVKLLY